MRRSLARAATVLLVPLAAALIVERAARSIPRAGVTVAESQLIWTAGPAPAFVCGDGGVCRMAPGLAALDNSVPSFSAIPASGTPRVVCIGDSTTKGWPYHPRGGYPEWLGAILRDVLPSRRAEVLNFGVHAWDGARLESVFAQALSFHPDAVVVRFGYDDYQNFFLRRPRGGAPARAALRARLFLLERSAAFRLLSRGLGPATPRGLVAEAEVPLTPAEEDELIEAHRERLRWIFARARAAGARIVVLGLPHWPAAAVGYPGLTVYSRLETATEEEARRSGVSFVPLEELKKKERFLDLVHSDLEGYRLTALAAARALAAAGFAAPAARWRWDRLATPASLERRLGLDEPEYRAYLETSLARYRLLRFRDRNGAARHLERALLLSKSKPDLIPSAEADDIPEMTSLYRETFTRLWKKGRLPPPGKPENRIMAGL